MGVYGIHIHGDVAPGKPRHYLGSVRERGDLDMVTAAIRNRLDRHARGRGARFMASVVDRGARWELVRVWPHVGLAEEMAEKRRGTGYRHLCPVCMGGWDRVGDLSRAQHPSGTQHPSGGGAGGNHRSQ